MRYDKTKDTLKNLLVGLLIIIIMVAFIGGVIWPTIYTADRLKHKRDFRNWMILGFAPAALVFILFFIMIAIAFGKYFRE